MQFLEERFSNVFAEGTRNTVLTRNAVMAPMLSMAAMPGMGTRRHADGASAVGRCSWRWSPSAPANAVGTVNEQTYRLPNHSTRLHRETEQRGGSENRKVERHIENLGKEKRKCSTDSSADPQARAGLSLKRN